MTAQEETEDGLTEAVFLPTNETRPGIEDESVFGEKSVITVTATQPDGRPHDPIAVEVNKESTHPGMLSEGSSG